MSVPSSHTCTRPSCVPLSYPISNCNNDPQCAAQRAIRDRRRRKSMVLLQIVRLHLQSDDDGLLSRLECICQEVFRVRLHSIILPPSPPFFPHARARTWMTPSTSNTNPGGYLEVQDICSPPRCDDDTFAGTHLETWGRLMLEASLKLGLPLNSAEGVKQVMEEAGYVDVVEVIYKWPMNRWPADKKMKEIGMPSLALRNWGCTWHLSAALGHAS